jgi:hypothetical protein
MEATVTLSDVVKRTVAWHPPLQWFSGAMLLTTVLCIGGLYFDHRTLVGSPLWMKPLKFSISFGLYAFTWAWMISLQSRSSPWLRWAARSGTVLALTSTIEMVIILIQTARGQQSHFNYATPFDSALWLCMQGTVVVLWSASLLGALLLMRDRNLDPHRTRMHDRSRIAAVRFGVLISLAGMSLAQLMTEPTLEQQAAVRDGSVLRIVGAHSVGVPDGGPALSITGWSTIGGDLRVPHFVGLHALQLLPLFVMTLGVLSRRWPRFDDEFVRLRLVRLAAALYAALVALLTAQALRGQPLLRPDGWTLGGLAALLIIGVVASARIVFIGRAAMTEPEWNVSV